MKSVVAKSFAPDTRRRFVPCTVGQDRKTRGTHLQRGSSHAHTPSVCLRLAIAFGRRTYMRHGEDDHRVHLLGACRLRRRAPTAVEFNTGSKSQSGDRRGAFCADRNDRGRVCGSGSLSGRCRLRGWCSMQFGHTAPAMPTAVLRRHEYLV